MVDFSDAEKRILSYFKAGEKIVYHGRTMTVEESGKPSCPHGEPKTDIYVLVSDEQGKEEIKITYKKENADFIENKTNAERAEQLFGSVWREIIQEATTEIQDSFERRIRIYKEKLSRTEKGAITLGWKFELMNKPGGELSGTMKLTPEQVYDIYAGVNLSEDKKNAFVNGRKISQSGVADYILISDHVQSAQDVIDMMVPISKYVKENPNVYFACKALNYRTFQRKYDGDRPLAVQVNWHLNNQKLTSNLVFDKPLEMNGREMAERLLQCLEYLKIKTTDDIKSENTDMKNVNE